MLSPSLDITFGGHRLRLDASGALYWPDKQLLILSDMHLEKSTFLASHGSLIPPYDTQHTLERLDQLLTAYQPRQLVFLGDSFHDRHAWERLPLPLRAYLEQLCQRVAECCWIEGNHDQALMHHSLESFETSRLVENILLSHDYLEGAPAQIIGHFHPKATVSIRGKKLSGKCFLHTEQLLIMPAFGSYTGGLDIGHPAFDPLIKGQPLQLYFLHNSSIHALSLPRKTTRN